MTSGENKEELMKFLFTFWKNVDASLLRGVEVILSHKDKCYRIIELKEYLIYREVEELTCDHEEADTRIIAHAKHASESYGNIVMKSPVFFIALNASLDINADIFLEIGVRNGRRIISLGNIRHRLGDPWCGSLLGLHAFTG